MEGLTPIFDEAGLQVYHKHVVGVDAYTFVADYDGKTVYLIVKHKEIAIADIEFVRPVDKVLAFLIRIVYIHFKQVVAETLFLLVG